MLSLKRRELTDQFFWLKHFLCNKIQQNFFSMPIWFSIFEFHEKYSIKLTTPNFVPNYFAPFTIANHKKSIIF